ncbi:2Fe-2S iron-sulfur cluster-binding protein [Novosphingobium sp.]|uniref:2Fe-2S iron-sulfur cluster-binding protein n=1 Tax=Novosphingobium sp. TaxID=1874826 RepID=UPI00286DFCF0|nr:2Fe-2S iron-sulfur cluster-binding protein [Novosphingobium sp.]
MTTFTVVAHDGLEQVFSTEAGVSIMEIIRDGGVENFPAICGGCCSCATCHVYIDPASLKGAPSVSEDENELLDSAEHRRSTSRLSCQVLSEFLQDGARVELPPAD